MALRAASSLGERVERLNLHGNIRAKKRVDYIKNLLEELGIEKERGEIHNLASNTGHRFVNLVKKMNDRVTELGPVGGGNK